MTKKQPANPNEDLMAALDGITAADLMQADVITLQDSASIREAVQTFEECGIKGAPVVDGSGKLVGMLTASDITQTGHLEGDRLTEARGSFYALDSDEDLGGDGSRRNEEFIGKHEFSPDVAGMETVGDWMTPQVISVPPEASVVDVCKVLNSERIHRVVVVYNSKVLGIVSAMDVVRLIATGE